MNEIFSIIISILVLGVVFFVILFSNYLMIRGGGIGAKSNLMNNFQFWVGAILFIFSFFYFCVSLSNMLYCRNPKYKCKWYDTQNLTFWSKQYWQHLF